jgi:leader peptidase (prepilin peptidase)/N-methyltransferase
MIVAVHVLIYILVFFAVASVGSFLNVLACRIPRKIGLVRVRSFCPACEHALKALDLVPIFSWLFLKGKCRYCGVKISPRYIAVETITGAVGLLFYVTLPLPNAVLFFMVTCVLLTITLIDSDTQEIPDSLNIAIFVLGIAAVWVCPEVGLLSRGIGIVVVSVPLFALALIIEGAFGMGDIKLMAAAGFLLGWQNTLVAFFIGILLGGGYGIFLLASKKKEKNEHFAFGPCLAIGIFFAMFAGDRLIGTYLSLF